MQKHQKKGEIERKMSSLSMVEAKLPPGFRFHPRDDELICDYLMNKFASCESFLLIEVDLNKTEPWEIPESACIGGKEWYFYSQRDRKYATGLRTNRATVSGYWKATGKDRPVVRNGSLVGMRKTLVFYQGRAPKGKKTDWVMHEFRLEGPLGPPKLPPSKEDWVLCRVFHKTRDELGKPTVAQTTSTGSYDMEPSPSSLPALMDSYITFDQTPQIVDAPRDDEDDDNTNIGNNVYEQVPCFSIFNPNQTNPPSTLSQLFNMEPNNIVTPKNILNINPMPSYHATPFGSYLQAGVLPTTAATATVSRNYHSDNGINPLSSGDEKVIKAVLSQLTKMEATPASNMKGSSSISHGEAASSESYLSDVGLPTMWSNHY